jgi:hypothetical protein
MYMGKRETGEGGGREGRRDRKIGREGGRKGEEGRKGEREGVLTKRNDGFLKNRKDSVSVSEHSHERHQREYS